MRGLRLSIIFFCILQNYYFLAHDSCFHELPEYEKKKVQYYIRDIFRTALDFNIDIFTRDTLKIVTAFTPLYLVTRQIDTRVHKQFYCTVHHKNINQMPRWCYHTVNNGITAELVALSALTFYPYNKTLSTTAYVFAISLPFTWIGKKFLKVFKTDAFVRPQCQGFCHHKKSFKGCPSGHVMEAVYAATLFGLEMGPAFGVPLGLFASAVFINFTTCNRHFVSQMVAGAGLGVIYAASSHKVINSILKRDLDCCFGFEEGKPALQISYQY